MLLPSISREARSTESAYVRAYRAKDLLERADAVTCLACRRFLRKEDGNHWCSNADCVLFNRNQATLPPKLSHLALVIGVDRETIKRDSASMGWDLPIVQGRRRGERKSAHLEVAKAPTVR